MVSLIIPTLNASEFLPDLLTRLKHQTIKDCELIIIDSSSKDNTIKIAKSFSAKIIVIPKEKFDHGRTRNIAAAEAKGDILVYLTQDVLPVDEFYLENLLRYFHRNDIAASYARQIPRTDAIPPERFARLFNYPDKMMIKGRDDIPHLGIKTFFFTNACSAIKKSAFEEVNKFPEQTIMNEDTLLAAKLVLKGYKIAYVSNAVVLHSHNYSPLQQFKRYFDIGVAFSRQKWFLELAAAEGEGFKYLMEGIKYMWINGEIKWIPYVFFEAAAKYAGYRLGFLEDKLPAGLKKRLSLHGFFWS
jgi:rhamnosyltransferase